MSSATTGATINAKLNPETRCAIATQTPETKFFGGK
jgi:hypothetical protein